MLVAAGLAAYVLRLVVIIAFILAPAVARLQRLGVRRSLASVALSSSRFFAAGMRMSSMQIEMPAIMAWV